MNDARWQPRSNNCRWCRGKKTWKIHSFKSDEIQTIALYIMWHRGQKKPIMSFVNFRVNIENKLFIATQDLLRFMKKKFSTSYRSQWTSFSSSQNHNLLTEFLTNFRHEDVWRLEKSTDSKIRAHEYESWKCEEEWKSRAKNGNKSECEWAHFNSRVAYAIKNVRL